MTTGVAQLNDRIRAGDVTVRTLEQLCRSADSRGESPETEVVVLAFVADIAGTAAMLCVPVAERGVFTRAAEITLNGVRGHPGPAPNERLGVVDALVFAGERAAGGDLRYDGAALFLDLVRGNAVEAVCRAVEGTVHRNTFRLSSLDFARLYVYNAAFPSGPEVPPGLLDALDAGARVLLNGSQGVLAGRGTRHRPGAPACSLAADLHGMDPELMSGSSGERAHNTLAFALPARDGALIDALLAWANSDARRALFCPAALGAAARLERLIRESRFLLTDAGVPAMAD